MTQAAVNRTVSERPSPRPGSSAIGKLPRRRRWGLVALGVALVAVCAVLAYLLVATAGITRPYLAVSREVPYGAVIGPDDLAEVQVNPAAGLDPLPADRRDQVIGKHAAVNLFPGTLLTARQVTDVVVPAPGQQVVGIELKPAQVPVRPLKPGEAVILVVVPAASLAGADEAQRPVSIGATVVVASDPDTSGNIRVDVAVAQIDGPTVAAMAAAGRIAIVVTTRD